MTLTVMGWGGEAAVAVQLRSFCSQEELHLVSEKWRQSCVWEMCGEGETGARKRGRGWSLKRVVEDKGCRVWAQLL